MKQKNDKKKMPLFWRVFLIATLSIAIIIVILAFVFSLYIGQYEQSRPETVISDFINDFSKDDLAKLITENFPEDCGDFLTREQVVNNTILPALGEEITYEKRMDEYTEETPVYTLVAGKYSIAKISFTSNGETFFGFTEWSEATLEYEADFSDLHYDAICIKVPGGSEVTFEGNKLGSNYRGVTEKYAGPSSEFEDPKKLPYAEIYNIGEGYGEPHISVTYRGTKLSVMSDTTDDESGTRTLCYSLPEEKTHTLTLTVPADTIVSLNGKKASGAYITESDIPYDGLDVWNAAAEHQPTCVKYVFPGLVSEVSFAVTTEDGTELTAISSDEATGTYAYAYPENMLIETKINAPIGSTVTLNGIALTENELASNSTVPGEIDGIDKYIKNPVKDCLYTVSGLYAEPKVTITDSEGNPLEVVITEDGTYSYKHATLDTLKAEHEQRVITFTENYIKYYTDGNQSIYKNFHELIVPHLQTGSEAYIYLNKVYSSLAWTAKCTLHSKQIETYDYTSWGDNAFSCKVNFTIDFYSPNSGIDTTETVTGWELFYVNTTGTENGWKIAKIVFN